MKNKTLKILSLGLATTSVVSTSTPVFAYEVDENENSIENVEYQNTADEDFENSTNVYAEIGSEYKVTIPKVVVLSGATKAAKYAVKVAGDIAGYEQVTVTPDNDFKLYAKNKDSQTATITQDKTVWKVADFEENALGQITADTITAGSWQGKFNFNINLEGEAPASITAGLFDDEGNLLKSWDELVELGLDVEKDYTESNFASAVSSGHSVFSTNNLGGNLVIPEGITKIGANALRDCDTITSIALPKSVSELGLAAFATSDNLKSIDMSKINVTRLGVLGDAGVEVAGLFEDCTSLSKVKLPKKLEEIGIGMFWNCGITSIGPVGSGASIEMPNTIKTIFVASFAHCANLRTVDLSETNLESLTGILATMQGTNYYEYYGAFRNCTSLEEVKLPNTLKIFGDSTFNGCKALAKVDIPASVERLGKGVLVDTAVTKINIPASVKEIGPELLTKTSKVEELTFENPDGWYYTDNYATTATTNIGSLNDAKNNVSVYLAHVSDVLHHD